MAHDQPTLTVITPDRHRFELIHVSSPKASARLLLVPAMGISARHYIDWAKMLTDLGIETFIHEWRGLGSSSLRASRSVNWGYQALLFQDLESSLNTVLASSKASSPKPLYVAGHSLGSQLALLLQAIRPEAFAGTILIAGGSPYHACFPMPMRLLLRTLFMLMPALANAVGYYPGYRLGFAGREARGVMADWARSGRTGRYEPEAVSLDLETALSAIDTPLLGLRMANDWFVPAESLRYLMAKCPNAQPTHRILGPTDPSDPANHYHWMRQPKPSALAIADWLATHRLN